MFPLDNRKELRKETLMAAFASNLEETLVVRCTIRNVSRGGCKLVTTEIDDLPETVHIVPEGFEKPLIGKIVWRDKKVAGVRFLTEAERAALKAKAKEPKHKTLGFLERFQIFSWRRKARDQVDAQASAPDDLVATVTHELRTPLTSLLGTLGLLVNGALGMLPEKVQSMIGIAHRNADRLSHLVDDLLDAKKAKSGKLKFSFAEADIVELVKRTVAANEAYGANNGVAFAIDDAVGHAIVRMDPGRIEQVLANLLSNAAKFSPKGQPVTVSLRQVDDRIRVAVSDRGVGIRAEMQDKIFDKYEQANLPSDGSRGTGLGLSISQMIAEQHGSRIHVDSTPGEGATFRFDLKDVG